MVFKFYIAIAFAFGLNPVQVTHLHTACQQWCAKCVLGTWTNQCPPH